MALDLKLNLKLSQQLVMTPQLQQAIKLLQMNRQELSELVNQELVENPVLEEHGETTGDDTLPNIDPEGEQKLHEDANAAPKDAASASPAEEASWEAYIEEFSSSYTPQPSTREINEELPSFESALTRTTTLEEHLLWQLTMTNLTPEEIEVGRLIIGNLSDDGYFSANLEDLARERNFELEDAEEILRMIQKFDPVGVAARNLQECLMIQASFLEPRVPEVETIIREHISELEKRNYPAIAKALGIPLDKVQEATKVILNLEPKPGRSFSSHDTQYITPDIYVYKVGGEFMIVLNEDGLPRLKIASYYKNILKNKSATGAKITKEYIQDKLRSALWLIRSIHNRQKTIYKVTEAIVKRQADFFDKGIQHLRPMILKDIAADIGMHESTISRVTTNKFVHTPVGIFELKYFFNSSIQSSDGLSNMASEAVKEKIKLMISREDPNKPLSDQKIVELLANDKIDIARRTVAKYREMLNILPSSRRKKLL